MKKNPDSSTNKITVKGKFLYDGENKFFIKGVTYGTFRPDENGRQFPDEATVDQDFRQMAAAGINCIRTYTIPPKSLLNAAQLHNLKVMVGLAWEQHITFLEKRSIYTAIIKRVREDAVQCRSHPAILCFAIGNEIPAGIVRWYGKKRIESFLQKLYTEVKKVSPETLITYVNYPTTEYLDLDFLDFCCFNVYLETPEKLGGYITRLQNLCGDKPLVMAEIGLDSRRNGEEKQAAVLQWQVKTIFEKGCAGMFVFAWTDEWWRGGSDIEDWDFGVVTREREHKPALTAVSKAFEAVPVCIKADFPFISVIVCSYNGSATIRECLSEILKLDYPSFEVIVVDDGSTNGLPEIVKEFPVKLFSYPNNGLSHARNTGMHHATGEILAYIDDDAFPDPHWLQYLAYSFRNSDHACIGGPNIAPSDDGFIATCVANAPGGPVHVLLSDEIAEHVPGCNMSFRKDVLMKIGGFDPVFRSAGDDVDVCWRIQNSGRTVGFHPSALVWHRRRNSFKAYWRQQKGYGKAEALLEAKWPEKYNAFGHLSWVGRIYGNGFTLPVKMKKDKIFHGTWGTALFQSVYKPAEGFWNSIPLMPEWYLFSLSMAILGALGFIWPPMFWCFTIFAASLAIVVMQAFISASKNVSLSPAQKKNGKYRLFIVLLHIIQPIARLYGRFVHGLTPWRNRDAGFNRRFLFSFRPKVFQYWSEKWRPQEDWLSDLEIQLKTLRTRVKRGGEFDDWDLQVKNGLFASCRSVLAIEEYGGGKQFLKLRCTPKFSFFQISFLGIMATVGVFAGLSQLWLLAILCGVLFLSSAMRLINTNARCINSLYVAFELFSVLDAAETHQFILEERIKNEEKKTIYSENGTNESWDLPDSEKGFK